MTKTYQIKKGLPSPLGVSKVGDGFNFALFSEHAQSVELALFTPHAAHPFFEISLDPSTHRTENIWHIEITSLPDQIEYAYRIREFDRHRLLSDPYARSLNTSHHFGQITEAGYSPRGRLICPRPFDWEGVEPPNIPYQDLIIYEMHVRAFTRHHSSKVAHPGTYLGVIEKIPHLKKLGVNAVELLPIYEFNECENERKNPKTHRQLYNFWGYSTVNFFSPMNGYATSSHWGAAIDEFKSMVKALHASGIEVILDVVYNHTAEGGPRGPNYSFRGIDERVYYMVGQDGGYLDFTGCGNTLNSNHPQVTKFIVDSLRYWVEEMHVDGFRFDLASALTRDSQGHPMASPPAIFAINNDPVLSRAKLIAEAWDCAGLYQVGSFPGGDRWGEWNGQYRDVVRRFIKGTDNSVGDFANVISGSEHLYGKERLPFHSVNFITAHDGFTLYDLVSYQGKHNLENGEENRDGCNNNENWNCGAEGKTTNRKILALREKQVRNFAFALLTSMGTPMILMGDEYCHSREGNNNAWCQDNERNWFLWDELRKREDFFRFFKELIAFRKKTPLLRRELFLSPEDVQWHGLEPNLPDWGGANRFLAYTLIDKGKGQHVYIAYNANFTSKRFTLPEPPEHKKWVRIVDTSLPSPEDFIAEPEKEVPLKATYTLQDHSAFLAIAL
jgi:isoamylase